MEKTTLSKRIAPDKMGWQGWFREIFCVSAYICTRVATYCPPQNSLSFPWFFPDILQFSIPSGRSSKKSFLFFNLMVLTVSLQI